MGILFEHHEEPLEDGPFEEPGFFADLNLGQVVDAIIAGKDEYRLRPFFHRSLRSIEAINFRHEVMRDLENATLFAQVRSFALKLRAMREHLLQAGKFFYEHQRHAGFIEAVQIYCDVVGWFAKAISTIDLRSRGLIAFRKYLCAYVRSSRFSVLVAETKALRADLAKVRYCVLIDGGNVTVRKCESEPNFSNDVDNTFARFKRGAAKDYRFGFCELPEMNHIEAQILEFVARLYPDLFAKVASYCARHQDYLDESVRAFDREIQFYVAYLEYLASFKGAGLTFCYPEISDRSKDIYAYEAFDVALARKLIAEKAAVVCNDFYLRQSERILAISGPNQGGKTTFARMFGQLHYLASLGCPVPGMTARLFLFDRLFTHFEREEKLANLRGKLQDDLVRIRDILGQATPKSLLIMNEIFTSTTLWDAIFLSEKILQRIIDLGLLCVWVTFIDEVASYGKQVVSMVSTVSPANPALRTFKILRRPPDGLAYATAVAEKHGLTYARLRERLNS